MQYMAGRRPSGHVEATPRARPPWRASARARLRFPAHLFPTAAHSPNGWDGRHSFSNSRTRSFFFAHVPRLGVEPVLPRHRFSVMSGIVETSLSFEVQAKTVIPVYPPKLLRALT